MQEPMKKFDHSAIGERFVNELLSESHEELYHHGIKGMKWGVRRFQNKDGTRTPAGLKRYAEKAKEGLRKAGEKIKERRSKNREEKAAENLRNKPLSKLTDEELQARIARAKKEQELFNLERPLSSLNKTQENLGKKFLVNAGQKVIGPALVDAGKDLMTRFLKDRVGNALGLNGKEMDDALSGLKKEVAELGLRKQKKELTDYLDGKTNSDDALSGLKKEVAELGLRKQKKELTDYLDGKTNSDDELSKQAKEWDYRKKIADGKKAEIELANKTANQTKPNDDTKPSDENDNQTNDKPSGNKPIVSESLSQKMADEAAKYLPSNSHASVSELYRKTFPDEYLMTKVEDLEDYRKWTK